MIENGDTLPNILTAGVRPFVPITTIRTSAQKHTLNETIKHLTLHFEPEDIQYLIVERDEEIIELIEHLENVKNRFDLQTRRRLASRILTIDQIQKDI